MDISSFNIDILHLTKKSDMPLCKYYRATWNKVYSPFKRKYEWKYLWRDEWMCINLLCVLNNASSSMRPPQCVLLNASSSMRPPQCVLLNASSSMRPPRCDLLNASSSMRPPLWASSLWVLIMSATKCVLKSASSICPHY